MVLSDDKRAFIFDVTQRGRQKVSNLLSQPHKAQGMKVEKGQIGFFKKPKFE